MAFAAAMMASLVLVAGSGIEVPTQPIVLVSRTVEAATDRHGICLEAPVTGPSIQGSTGNGRLCLDGTDVRSTLTVTSLPPGEVYSAVLSFTPPAEPCEETPCGDTDLAGGTPPGLTHLMGGGVVPPSRSLDFQYDLRQVSLLSGGRVTLLLLKPDGRAGPYAQAVFAIP